MDNFGLFMDTGGQVGLATVVLSLGLALILSQAIAAVYVWTFRGMSYTRSYVQTIVVGSLVACMLMLAINNNLAAGFGIAGSLAFVRFRTSMRDPRDMAFVFAGLSAGIVAGLRTYEIAIVGSIAFCVTSVVFSQLEVGRRNVYDGLLRFAASPAPDLESSIAKHLKQGTQRFALVGIREVAQGQRMEHAYQIRIKKLEDRVKLVNVLSRTEGVEDVTLHLQDETTEI